MVDHTPVDGAVDVGVTFRPQVFFSRPVYSPSLDEDNFFATFGGEKFPAAIVPAGDGRFGWLFFNGAMADASHVTVTVDGSTILPLDGGPPLDANGDGEPGGVRTYRFTTVSVVPLPETSLTGIIVDPGPDREPMTEDDVDPGPDETLHTDDDVFLLPIEGVEVFLLGLEEQKRITGPEGRFTFDSVPVGNVKLAVNGMTAAAPPDGLYFPEMVIDVNIEPAIENFPMAGTPHLYLPRLPSEILRQVDGDGSTMIVADDVSAPDLPPGERHFLSVDIQPGSLVDANGGRLESGQVGLSTVPPDLVRDMLPPGVLQHTFDITLQAPGISNFSTPAPMTFPNVFGAAPGTKLNFLSFDHTTGRLVIEGTATVSADGLFVTTDPDTGITHPGWHGLTPPGGCGGSGGPPPRPPEPSPEELVIKHDAIALDMVFGDNGGWGFLPMSWVSPSPPPDRKRPPAQAPGCGVPEHDPDEEQKLPFISVTIEIDGPLAEFAKKGTEPEHLPLTNQSFTLTAGPTDVKKFVFNAKTYEEMFGAGGIKNLNRDHLYGAKIKITEVRREADGSRTRDIFTFYAYRWVNVIYAPEAKSKAGNSAAFHRTLTDPSIFGSDGFHRTKTVGAHLPKSVRTSFTGPLLGSPFVLSNTVIGGKEMLWLFDPTLSGERSDSFDVKVDGLKVGSILARGTATNRTTVNVNVEGYKVELKRIIKALQKDATGDIFHIFPDSTKKFVSNKFKTQFAGFMPGDAYTEAQLDAKMQSEADALKAAIKADYDTANKPEVGYQFVDSGGDVTMSWKDLGGRLYGSADYDSDETFLKPLITNDVISPAAKEWALAQALNQKVVNKGEFSVAINVSWTSGATFAQFMANTVSHEIAHTFGLNDSYLNGNGNINPANDIMNAGSDSDADLTFSAQNQNLLKAALGFHRNADKPLTAELKMYRDNINLPNSRAGIRDVLDEPAPGIGVSAAGETLFPDDVVTFDDVAASNGTGGATTQIDLTITSNGQLPLIIDSVSLSDGSAGFSIVAGVAPGTTLGLEQSTVVTVEFNPAGVGGHQDTLTINSNSGGAPAFSIGLTGTGLSPDPVAAVELLDNNNLGGLPVAGGSAEVAELASITNLGVAPLVIADIALVEGIGPFSLLGLPADMNTNPINLALGESFIFGVGFDPNRLGIERALIQVVTNDPDRPNLRISAVGTGLDQTVYPHWGNDYIAIETPDLPGSVVLRDLSDDQGNFQLFLPSEEPFHMVIFDPVTGLVSHSFGTSARSGQGIDLTSSIVFSGSVEPDGDSDGLPDDVEFALGTSATKADTDGDGLSDFVEVAQGLDPLGGRSFPTGIIANVRLRGEARDLVVEGRPRGEAGQIAYVADGSGGLAIVDASQFNKPTLLSQLGLPGTAEDVGVDATVGIAAVAAGAVGLHLVDVSDPVSPALLQTVELPDGAARVEVFDGLAYVASGTSVHSIDLLTGEFEQALGLGGAQLTDIAREDAMLYTMDADRTLRAVDLSGFDMMIRGSLALTDGGGRLFVGNGIAYAVAESNFRGGFATADVSNPDEITLISGSDVPSTE